MSCEISATNLPPGEEFSLVEVTFLPPDIVAGIESGATVLVSTDAMINVATNELTVSAGANYQVRTILFFVDILSSISQSLDLLRRVSANE